MKIHLPSQSKQKIGGGWTFLGTFEKFAAKAGMEITDYFAAEAILISGATMVERDYVEKAKHDGKKIILRIDNIPRNSRNRNTGTSRLYDFAQLADLIIFQSQWARSYIAPFLKKDGPVILNGADESVFRPDGSAQPAEGSPQVLYTQFNRDETKQWHQAWYEYIMQFRKEPKSHLWIVGNFSPEHQQYNFDFFMGEKIRYVGVLDNPEDMAEYFRGTNTLYLPYFNDACSNTLIEFLLCKNPEGHKKDWQVLHNGTGGNDEILEAYLKGPQFLSATRMVTEYAERLNALH